MGNTERLLAKKSFMVRLKTFHAKYCEALQKLWRGNGNLELSTSLAAKGALAVHPAHNAAHPAKLKWPPGAPKWPIGREGGWIIGLGQFRKILPSNSFYSSSRFIRKVVVENREKIEKRRLVQSSNGAASWLPEWWPIATPTARATKAVKSILLVFLMLKAKKVELLLEMPFWLRWHSRKANIAKWWTIQQSEGTITIK